MNETPGGLRLHIAIFGRRNAGKSTLINALLGQELAITSDVPGTTADPVKKSVELHPIGPCVMIDTAGFDDTGALGTLRVAKTREVIEKTDMALLVCAGEDLTLERAWAKELAARKIPTVAVLNKIDALPAAQQLAQRIEAETGLTPVPVSAVQRTGIEALRTAIVRAVPPDFDALSLTGHLTAPGDVALLVMPQDIQAPKGRLILPQVQTIRALLDGHCVVVSCTAREMTAALQALAAPPALIICDSQCFREVYANKPEDSRLTSFSVLLARYKGDISAFAEGARAIDALRPGDRVLIAEACTHNAQDGDIGRVKIPALLRKKVGGELQIDVVSGADFKNDLSKYALIIHCGACMFNRKYVLSRIAAAQHAGVPITNYGIALAKLTGILPHVELE